MSQNPITPAPRGDIPQVPTPAPHPGGQPFAPVPLPEPGPRDLPVRGPGKKDAPQDGGDQANARGATPLPRDVSDQFFKVWGVRVEVRRQFLCELPHARIPTVLAISDDLRRAGGAVFQGVIKLHTTRPAVALNRHARSQDHHQNINGAIVVNLKGARGHHGFGFGIHKVVCLVKSLKSLRYPKDATAGKGFPSGSTKTANGLWPPGLVTLPLTKAK